MRITQSMARSIAATETRKKFDQLKKDAETSLNKMVEDEVKEKYTFKVPQSYIDDGLIRTCCEAKIKFKEDDRYGEGFTLDSSYPIKALEDCFRVKKNKKLEAAFNLKEKLDDDSDKFEDDLLRIINSFTTHTNLLIHLPELKDHFVDADLAKSMALVPVEQINAIRKQIVRP